MKKTEKQLDRIMILLYWLIGLVLGEHLGKFLAIVL